MLFAGVVFLVAVGGVAYWAKGKVDQAIGDEQRIEQLRRQANRNVFRRPADATVEEERLLRFLAVRARVHEVYDRYRDRLERWDAEKQPRPSDLTGAFKMVNEIRLAHAQALADQGMSEDEYRYLDEQVYGTSRAASAGGSAVAANQALLRRHQAEIDKHVMRGLEWIGL